MLTWSAGNIRYTRGRNVNPQFLKKKKKGFHFSFKTFPLSREFDFSDNHWELHNHLVSNTYTGLTYKKTPGTVQITSCSPQSLIMKVVWIKEKSLLLQEL